MKKPSISRAEQPLVVDPLSACSKALSNHLILANIFRFLDLNSLKIARLVSQVWGVEGLKKFSDFDVIILLQPPFKGTTAAALESLFNKDQLRPCLDLSFQTPGWAYISNHAELKPSVYEKNIISGHRPRNHKKTDIKALKVLQAIGPWVVELRLELTLMHKRDAQLVVNIMATMPNLTKLCIDFFDLREKGLLGFPSYEATTCHSFLPASLTILGIQIIRGAYWFNGHGATLKGVIHFMKSISGSNIQLLDLVGREFKFSNFQDPIVVKMWMEAISHILTHDSKAFPRLSGFMENWRRQDDDRQISNPPHNFYHFFPRSLSHLHLGLSYIDLKKREDWLIQMDQLLQTIQRHALTLQTLYLENFWCRGDDYYPFNDNVEEHQRLAQPGPRIIPNFPVLTSLSLTTHSRDDVVTGGDLERMNDATFNLRHVFLSGPQALERLFPSLTTLSIEVQSGFYKGMVDMSEHIIPTADLMEQGLEFHQIKHLNIWIIVEEDENGGGHDDCISSSLQLSRLLSIFPSLKTLRHLKKKRRANDDIKIFFVCNHVRSSPPRDKNVDSQTTPPSAPTWTTFTKTWKRSPKLRKDEELEFTYERLRLQHLLTYDSNPWCFW